MQKQMKMWRPLAVLCGLIVTGVTTFAVSSNVQPPINGTHARSTSEWVKKQRYYSGPPINIQGPIDYTFTCDDETETITVARYYFTDDALRSKWGSEGKLLTKRDRWTGSYNGAPYYNDKIYKPEVEWSDDWVSEGARRLWTKAYMKQHSLDEEETTITGNYGDENVTRWEGWSAGWSKFYYKLSLCECDPVVQMRVQNKLTVTKNKMVWTPNLKHASDTTVSASGSVRMTDVFDEVHEVQVGLSEGAITVIANEMGVSGGATVKVDGTAQPSVEGNVGGSVTWSREVTLSNSHSIEMPHWSTSVYRTLHPQCDNVQEVDVRNDSSWDFILTDGEAMQGGCSLEWEYECKNLVHLLWIDLVGINLECLPCGDPPTTGPSVESPVRVLTTAAGEREIERENRKHASNPVGSRIPSDGTGELSINFAPGDEDTAYYVVELESSDEEVVGFVESSDSGTYDQEQGAYWCAAMIGRAPGTAVVTVRFIGYDGSSETVFDYTEEHEIVVVESNVLEGPSLIVVSEGESINLQLSLLVAFEDTEEISIELSEDNALVWAPEELEPLQGTFECIISGADPGSCVLTVEVGGVEYEVPIEVIGPRGWCFKPTYDLMATHIDSTSDGCQVELLELEEATPGEDYTWEVAGMSTDCSGSFTSYGMNLSGLPNMQLTMQIEAVTTGTGGIKVQMRPDPSSAWVDVEPEAFCGYSETGSGLLSVPFGGDDLGWAGSLSGLLALDLRDFKECEEFQFRIVYAFEDSNETLDFIRISQICVTTEHQSTDAGMLQSDPEEEEENPIPEPIDG